MVRQGVTVSDRAQLRDITNEIERGEVGRASVLKTIANPLRTLLRASYSVSYGLSEAGDSMRCAFFYSQLPAAMRTDLDASLVATPIDTWATYDPRCPEPSQRNRVFSFPIKQLTTTGAYPVLRKYGVNTAQTRLLVCDGPSLLAWVGAFRDDEFTRREHWLLRQVSAPLRDRLTLERRLEQAAETRYTLELVLEHIGRAAFLINARGHVVHANAAGKARVEVDGGVIDRTDPSFEVHETRTPGVATLYLVIARQDAAPAHSRAAQAAARFGLTPRQQDVLLRIVRGFTNARIAAELRISERTVEVHMTAILDRAQCGSRSELISAVLLLS